MNAQTIERLSPSAAFRVTGLENASTDLFIADSMVEAIERFLEDVRDIVKPTGLVPNAYVDSPVTHASTLLGELRDKIAGAKAQLDESVTAAIADGLPR